MPRTYSTGMTVGVTYWLNRTSNNEVKKVWVVGGMRVSAAVATPAVVGYQSCRRTIPIRAVQRE
jgi:hypothetical protein